MGVPSFFRWLLQKYPKSVVYVVEEPQTTLDGVDIPIDLSKPNPNGVEFDNLYLDMNGIIHNCTHGEHLDRIPRNEDDMFNNIFMYLDRVMAMIRPRQLLYMAVDGVAPRAKMNQQRARRYGAAQDRIDQERADDMLRAELGSKGYRLPPKKKPSWDSNQITPGTEFMMHVSEHIRWYIHDRMTNNPYWRDLTVIFSDGSVPGEGEHKIMEFIRKERAQPGYNPNTRHVLHGLDADLIMLGLATHEPYFTIVREEVVFGRVTKCELCGREGHTKDQCLTIAPKEKGMLTKTGYLKKRHQFIHLFVLREYLESEFGILRPILGNYYDFERIIDDVIFLLFFVGNDFLPHLPCLSIREGAIGLLFNIYMNLLPKLDGYLTEDGGRLNLTRIYYIFKELSKYEDEILRRRLYIALSVCERDSENQVQMDMQRNKKKQAQNIFGSKPEETKLIEAKKEEVKDTQEKTEETAKKDAENEPSNDPEDMFNSIEKELDKEMDEHALSKKYDILLSHKLTKDAEHFDVVDNIKLGTTDWRRRYYQIKFPNECNNKSFYNHIAQCYIQGLCWVMAYYYSGCASWSWYFPYHYAPCVSTLLELDNFKFSFELGRPLSPIEQLMAVQPPSCSYLVPKACAALMTEEDSPLREFYPKTITYDTDGKPFKWLWIVQVPFIDEKKLCHYFDTVKGTFTLEDQKRNRRGDVFLIVHESNPLVERMKSMTAGSIQDPALFPIFGFMNLENSEVHADMTVPAPNSTLKPVNHTQAVFLSFLLPKSSIHHSQLLPNVDLPPDQLLPQDKSFGEPVMNRNMHISDLATPLKNNSNSYKRNTNDYRDNYSSSNDGPYKRPYNYYGGNDPVPPPPSTAPYNRFRNNVYQNNNYYRPNNYNPNVNFNHPLMNAPRPGAPPPPGQQPPPKKPFSFNNMY